MPCASELETKGKLWSRRDAIRFGRTRFDQRSSIRVFERGEMRDSNRKPIRFTLEQAGIAFIAENGGGAGVRLAKPKRVF
jgi:hypothetical protein